MGKISHYYEVDNTHVLLGIIIIYFVILGITPGRLSPPAFP